MSNQKLCEVSEKTKIVINKCLEKGYTIDIIKIQQLLTLIQGTMLAKYNTLFFQQGIIMVSDGPIIKEIMQDVLTREINLSKNDSDYILSAEEESVVDNIIKKFGIYDCNTINTSFVLNVLNKICSTKEETIIPIEYLKKVFLEFEYGNTEENKTNEKNNNSETTREKFIDFAKEYDNLVSTDFPRKWMPDPETGYIPPELDLVELADRTTENGFVENYCLDEYDAKKLRLIRYYKQNYLKK